MTPLYVLLLSNCAPLTAAAYLVAIRLASASINVDYAARYTCRNGTECLQL